MNIIQNVRARNACARACLCVCTRLFESGAGTGHWMEIMKAFLQGSGEEDKFGNARWGKGGREQTSGCTFLHTVSVGVTRSRGGEPRLRVELVWLPEEFLAAQPSTREEECASAVWCPILPENYITARTQHIMQMSFFCRPAEPREVAFFSQSKTKQKKQTFLAALVNSIFTAVCQKGKLSVFLRVSHSEGLKRWIILKKQMIQIMASHHVFLRQTDTLEVDRLDLAYLCPVLPARQPK